MIQGKLQKLEKKVFKLFLITLLLFISTSHMAIYCNEVNEQNIEYYIQQDSLPCVVISNLCFYKDSIIYYPEKYFNDKMEDNCVLSLISTIYYNYISTTDSLYWRMLSAIGSISDGYISEHLSTILADNSEDNILKLLKHLDQDDLLYEYLINGAAMNMIYVKNYLISIQGISDRHELTDIEEDLLLTIISDAIKKSKE